MNYFVVRVPLSYLNVVEAQHYFNIRPEESTLVVMRQNRHPVDLQVINAIVDPSLWSEIHYVAYNLSSFSEKNTTNPIDSSFRKAKAIKLFVNELNSVVKKGRTTSRVFIGNEDTVSMRHIAHAVKPEEVIVVDEGFAVINNVVEKKRRQSSISKVQEKLKIFLSSNIYGYKIEPLREIIYFSSYDFKTGTIRKIDNTYAKLRSQLAKRSPVDQVLFLGQSLVENSHLTEDVYFDCMRHIKNYYGSRKLLYCVHRDEQQGKLQRLQKELNIEILHSHLPIEYRLTTMDQFPETIASFYSSALQNSHHILKGAVKIESFMLQPGHFISKDESMLNKIHNCYRYLKELESESFRVVELPISAEKELRGGRNLYKHQE